jgi:hypothetical protein
MTALIDNLSVDIAHGRYGWPTCDKCNKRVEAVASARTHAGGLVVVAYCHDKEERITIPPSVLKEADRVPGSADMAIDISGQVFKPAPKLLHK